MLIELSLEDKQRLLFDGLFEFLRRDKGQEQATASITLYEILLLLKSTEVDEDISHLVEKLLPILYVKTVFMIALTL